MIKSRLLYLNFIVFVILILALNISCSSRFNHEQYITYRKNIIGREFPFQSLKGHSKIDSLDLPTMAVIWSKTCGISLHQLSLSKKIEEGVNGKLKIIAITNNENARPPDKVMEGANNVDFFSLTKEELIDWNFLKNGYPVSILIDNKGIVRDYILGLPSMSDSLIIKEFISRIEPLKKDE
jgi:hypothetical protein